MHPPLQRDTIIFIVRVWKEYLHPPNPKMRGEIELVNGKEKLYFSTMHQLEEILHEICLQNEEKDKNC